ncbi:MAG: STAS domain-containing protein [Solirubrobacterales bacterium]|nr:STAS domain-containing protein [Solirubrobacterales bacterium]
MAGLAVADNTDLTFDVVETDAQTVTVRLAGELDITNVERLAAAVAPELEREPDRLIVDVGELHFADSSAIALWVKWAASVARMELRHVPPLLRRVVDSMGLSETLKVQP